MDGLNNSVYSRNQLVTIIVPIYKVERFMAKCAESLLSQTYPEIEYVFVNDCTPDGSMNVLNAVIARYPHRKPYITIVNNETNRGLAYCRNIGMKHAHGDYVMHVDSDDYIAENAVEMLMSVARQSKADIVVTDFFLVTPRGVKEIIHTYPEEKEDYLENVLKRDLPACIWGKLYKRNLYCEHDITVPERIDFGEDMVTLPRLVYYAEKIAVAPPFYYYNQLNVNSYTKCIGEKAITSVIRTEQTLRTFFLDKIGREELERLLSVYRQKMRAELLFNTSAALRKKYAGLFKQDGIDLRLIPSLRQRLFICLLDKHLYLLANLYLSCYHFLQMCKRRILG